VVVAFFAARGIFRHQSKKRYNTARTLAEALGAQARASIDAAKKKLPAPR
jgi:hypothetical protein